MNNASIVEEYYVPIYIMHTGECSCLGTETVCVVTYICIRVHVVGDFCMTSSCRIVLFPASSIGMRLAAESYDC